jgi:hypothetical protein
MTGAAVACIEWALLSPMPADTSYSRWLELQARMISMLRNHVLSVNEHLAMPSHIKFTQFQALSQGPR